MAATKTPNEVLDWLVAHKQLLTFRAAYQAIFGEDAFSPRDDTRLRLLLRARTSKQVEVGRLMVQLDALLVGSSTGIPSPSHFKNNVYTLDQWQVEFGEWPVTDQLP